MAALHFTIILGEPNINNRHIESHIFGEICPCANNIVYDRLDVFNFSVRFYVRF